ncbi:MAG: hypothetical protein QOD32_2304 [Pyrinomonadaceae bacterium]|jgi:preprotein translocase subunit SecB|nr:hypothetical protein [Pyrinomonadaceae bacterium]
MTVQLSPLQLEGYFVRELSFRVKPGLDEQMNCHMESGLGFQVEGLFNPDPLTINVQSGITGHKEDPSRWQCLVRIESRNPPDRKYPYDFLVEIVGYFKVHEQVPREHIEKLININGASVLYSAGREVLANATARGNFPHVLLPTVVFTVDDEAEQKQLPAKKEDVSAVAKKPVKKRAGKKAAKKGKGV